VKAIWRERKVMVASATGVGLLFGYGLGAKWPHLLTAFPTLATALVTLAAGFFAGNVVAKKFEPKPPGDP
jgi:hypothetical protein